MGIKSLAYRLMSQSSKPTRTIKDLFSANTASYAGGWDPNTGEPYTTRDLNHLYLYGNTKGQFTSYSGAPGVSYTNYLQNQGKDPEKVPQYEGAIQHSEQDNTFPLYAKPYIENLAKSGYGKTIGYTSAFGDNVAGHVGKVGINRNGEPAIIVSDLWDFSPKEYGKKWGGTKAYIQSYALDKVGTPFILRDDTSNIITYSDEDSWDTQMTPEKAQIMLNAGIIPEVTVTPTFRGHEGASVYFHGMHPAQMKKQGGILNYFNYFK